MARSLSLAAYRALSRRRPQTLLLESPRRPEAELVWAHATNAVRLTALGDLANRLKTMRPGLRVLLTHVPGLAADGVKPPAGGADWVVALDSDHPATARQFLAHWQPDFCLWAGGILLPNLIAGAAEQRMPMALVDLGSADLQTSRHKWFPDLTRSSLDFFGTIMANNQTTARSVRRMGIEGGKISVTARLRAGAMPPFCADDDLDAVIREVGARPVWLAAKALPAEFGPILAAHRAALRLAHRLLLVITLADPASATAMKELLTRVRLRFADWDNGDATEDSIQVILSANSEDLGLWYRVAPLTFLASSLSEGGRGISPMDAAALGSAVLYGPHVGDHLDSYSRLAAAGAARAVSDGESLGAAVVQLVAPDHAATMALAGWEVATDGADLIDALIDLVQDALDRKRAADARA